MLKAWNDPYFGARAVPKRELDKGITFSGNGARWSEAATYLNAGTGTFTVDRTASPPRMY